VPFLLPLFFLVLSACETSTPPHEPARVVTQLTALLRDPSPDVRRTAALSLGKIAAPEATGPLVDGLKDADPEVREHCAWALGNIGEPALDAAGMALAGRLHDPVPAVAAAAAGAIGRMGGTQAIVELLTDALLRGSTAARRAAVFALAWLEAPSSFSALARALTDRDVAVRQGAVAALGEVGDPRAVPLRIERLRRDPDAGVRNEAAFRLGKFGDRSAVAALSAAQQDPKVKGWASWALTEIEQGPT
jgi:HEAT repeat protein